MPNLSEQQKAQQRQNCRKYNLKTSRKRLLNIIKDNFQSATLLTLYFNPAVPMPPKFVSKYLESLDSSARWISGGKYEYVRITEYTNFESGAMVFRYITNLTEAQCEKIAANWCMGKTEIAHLSPDDIDSIPQTFPVCSAPLQRLEKYRRWWSRSHGIRS